jgi:hypothetical protein
LWDDARVAIDGFDEVKVAINLGDGVAAGLII